MDGVTTVTDRGVPPDVERLRDALEQALDRIETSFNLIHPGDFTEDEVHGLAQGLYFGAGGNPCCAGRTRRARVATADAGRGAAAREGATGSRPTRPRPQSRCMAARLPALPGVRPRHRAMSRARVIIGRAHDGRPVSRWADTVAGDAPYGFMEPAFEPVVTKRMATPAELAASVARDTAPGYLHAKPATASRRVGAWTPEKSAERMRISRERGTRSVELAATARATPAQREWNGTGLRPNDA